MTPIALNARFHAHRPTGMQRYALELTRRFPNYLDPLQPNTALRGMGGHLWEQLCLPAGVRGRLLWSPNNTGPLAVARQVCTIHDLIPLDHPEWFNRRFAGWYTWLLPRLAKQVRHIIAVSHFTRQRIIERLGVPASKVTVIPNGVDARFTPQSPQQVEMVRRALGITSPCYMLTVGSVEPRKNLHRLLEAWRRAQSSVPPDVDLVVTGGLGNARVFGGVPLKSIPPRVHFTGYVGDALLPGLYSGAAALLYPSLYEGFGLPPLEAMACGVPVMVSSGTSLPEVVGDAGVLVDPLDEDSIADGILRVLTESGSGSALRMKSQERARGFSWENTAQWTLEVLLRHSAWSAAA
jgi:glycosyltransferase involved in cell wall biosynthesis